MSADIASVTIDKLRRENEEQARLLAGVSEREARLLARIGELQKDKERLDSSTILLTVNGERVHHVGVNLRDAIDLGRKEVVHP